MTEFGKLSRRECFLFDGTHFMVIDPSKPKHPFGRAMSERGRMVRFHRSDVVQRDKVRQD